MTPSTLAAAALAAIMGASQVQADFDQGSVTVRIGAGSANPADDSNWLRLDGVSRPDTRVYIDDGKNATFTVAWLIFNHRGRGLLAAIPFEHDIEVSGLPGPIGKLARGRAELGEAEQLPVTVTMQWLPVPSKTRVQPYFAGTLGAVGEADLDHGRSWGLAGELGVDISLGRDNRLLMNAAVLYLDSDVQLRLLTNSSTLRTTSEVEIDPWVYSVGIGYRF